LASVQNGEILALTLPKLSAITNAKWEEKISRKYHVAPSSIESRTVVKLPPDSAFDFLAQRMVSKNARQSGCVRCGRISDVRLSRRVLPTKKKGEAGICDLHASVQDEYTQMVCVEGYRWERLGYKSTIASRRSE
jgi:hypothetical protein